MVSFDNIGIVLFNDGEFDIQTYMDDGERIVRMDTFFDAMEVMQPDVINVFSEDLRKQFQLWLSREMKEKRRNAKRGNIEE